MTICENFESYTLPKEGKCQNYKIEICVEGAVKENGVVMDFGKLKEIYRKVIEPEIKHANINHRPSTVENLAKWIADNLHDELKPYRAWIKKVVVWKSPTSKAVYEAMWTNQG